MRKAQGTLAAIPEEFPFGTEVYNKLYARIPPKDVVAWLNAAGQRPRGMRVRLDDDSVVELAKEQWDTDQLTRWVRNPINKGIVQLGDHVSGVVHDAVTTEEIWNAVNLRKNGTRTGGGANPGLCSSVLRCQYCRGTLSLVRDEDGAPKRYHCTNKGCRAHASILAEFIEPLVESALLASLHAVRERMEMQPAADHDEHLPALRRAAQDALQQMRRRQADLQLAEDHPDRYAALCDAAEGRVNTTRAALQTAQQAQRVGATTRNVLDDWPQLSTSQRGALIACTWPIIWVRIGEYIDDAGCLRRNVALEDRLWFIPEGDETKFVLPQKGRGWNPAAHEPVQWPDGSTTPSIEERRRLRNSEREVAPSVVVSDRSSAEDAQRWCAARTHFLQLGRTAEEVLSAWREFGFIRGARGSA